MAERDREVRDEGRSPSLPLRVRQQVDVQVRGMRPPRAPRPRGRGCRPRPRDPPGSDRGMRRTRPASAATTRRGTMPRTHRCRPSRRCSRARARHRPRPRTRDPGGARGTAAGTARPRAGRRPAGRWRLSRCRPCRCTPRRGHRGRRDRTGERSCATPSTGERHDTQLEDPSSSASVKTMSDVESFFILFAIGAIAAVISLVIIAIAHPIARHMPKAPVIEFLPPPGDIITHGLAVRADHRVMTAVIMQLARSRARSACSPRAARTVPSRSRPCRAPACRPTITSSCRRCALGR